MSNSQSSGIALSTIFLYVVTNRAIFNVNLNHPEALGRNAYFSPEGETLDSVFCLKTILPGAPGWLSR